MEKVINMGWAKFPNDSRRHKIVVNVELKLNVEGKPVLSMFGEIKGRVCGQCPDTIKKYAVEKRQNFDEILDIWKAWHLNDMHAGTERQEQALKRAGIRDFDAACKYLQEQGIYEDGGYKYGFGWLYKAIPRDVLNKIFSW